MTPQSWTHGYNHHVVKHVAERLEQDTPTDSVATAHTALQGLRDSQTKSPLTPDEVRAIWQLVNTAADGERRESAEARHTLRSLLVEHARDWGASHS